MSLSSGSAFNLPDHLAAKAETALICEDEQRFTEIEESLRASIADLSARLDATRRAAVRIGQEAMDRDMEAHRLAARLRTLRRYGIDLCLGRIVPADDAEPLYIGRVGLADQTGRRLLIDWRTPAAEPFFGATHGNPMGLASRRRYRWANRRVSDYWDEVFTREGLEHHAALDDQSAFIASLASSRSPRMQDVLSTIQADQDAIVRAGSRGALVVDGGPGTGKTVVALHRAAYLLHADAHLEKGRGDVLFVGPHQPYLTYVSDVLPSLGEEGVQTVTIRGLIPEGAEARPEEDPEVARLKGAADMIGAIEPAVRLYEEIPASGTEIATPFSDVWVSPQDWAEAFQAPDPGTPHNEARDQIWEELLTILVDKHPIEDSDDMDEAALRRALAANDDLVDAMNRAWPIIDPHDLVGDLWEVPAYLRMCAPWLSTDEVRTLQRSSPRAWTISDVPLLDAARRRLGDPQSSMRRRRRTRTIAAERERMDRVIDELLQLDDEDGMLAQLRQDGVREALIDESAFPEQQPDRLAGPFAHVIVDEAQELTDAQWQMLLSRCPSRSFTIVGDRAQARHGFAESWEHRLRRVGLDNIRIASLTINYRTPQEVMAEAEPGIRAVLPDANVPTSIRAGGAPVLRLPTTDLATVLNSWLEAHAEGTVCIIGEADFPATPRVRSLSPALAKGLEFDLVVLVEPEKFGQGVQGAVDRYVAMTRATQQLIILTNPHESLHRTEVERADLRTRRKQ